MQIDYTAHCGKHQVSIVYCPRILGNRLAHLSQDGPNSWALRDFITRRMIRNSPPPNRASSHRMLGDIEAEVTWFEPPPAYRVEHRDEWALYLRLRTSAEHVRFGISAVLEALDLSLPNPDFGDWEEMR